MSVQNSIPTVIQIRQLNIELGIWNHRILIFDRCDEGNQTNEMLLKRKNWWKPMMDKPLNWVAEGIMWNSAESVQSTVQSDRIPTMPIWITRQYLRKPMIHQPWLWSTKGIVLESMKIEQYVSGQGKMILAKQVQLQAMHPQWRLNCYIQHNLTVKPVSEACDNWHIAISEWTHLPICRSQAKTSPIVVQMPTAFLQHLKRVSQMCTCNSNLMSQHCCSKVTLVALHHGLFHEPPTLGNGETWPGAG